MTVALHRMYVDSETRTPQSGDIPNLVFLHKHPDPNIKVNLFELAGFDHAPCDILSKEGWRRSLPRTARKTYAGGGGGLIDSDPPEITRDELTDYIDSNGTKGPPFRILSMSTRMQNNRISAAETVGRQLGLILTFDTRLKEVTDPTFLRLIRTSFWVGDPKCEAKARGQEDYLICELGRRPEDDWLCCDFALNPTTVSGSITHAHRDLCSPVAVGVFRYTTNEFSGWTSNLIGTSGYEHDLSARPTSGVSFRAQIPEEVRKWVLIHELGHYFGLTHVNGFDRIMVSGTEGQGSVWSWDAIPLFLVNGGPRFTLGEAKQAWDFILTNFPPECLRGDLLDSSAAERAPPVIL
jgi:hypothetical protein